MLIILGWEKLQKKKKKKEYNDLIVQISFLFYSKIWKSKYNECQLKKFHLEAFF